MLHSRTAIDQRNCLATVDSVYDVTLRAVVASRCAVKLQAVVNEGEGLAVQLYGF